MEHIKSLIQFKIIRLILKIKTNLKKFSKIRKMFIELICIITEFFRILQLNLLILLIFLKYFES